MIGPEPTTTSGTLPSATPCSTRSWRSCSSLSPAVLHQFIWAGIEQQHDVLREAPQALRDFFQALDEPPPWLDHDAFRPAVRAFHANADLMLVAFVTGVLIEGFSTLIAKSFNITGANGQDQETPSSRTTAS